MSSPKTKATAALSVGAALLVLLGGWFDPAVTAGSTTTTAASSSVTPAPPYPTVPGGALPVRPAGGGGCVIGLNCGCIPNITCPKPPRHRPGNANGEQHPAPTQQVP